MSKGIICLIISLAAVIAVPAQTASYSIPNTLYVQDFNGLPPAGSFTLAGKGPFYLSAPPINASDCAGWQFMMNAGSASNASFLPGTGSSTTHGVYSLGAAGSPDRSLGSLASGTGIYSFGIVFTNN